jgi:hypothetical protein
MEDLSSASAARNVDRMVHQTSYMSKFPTPMAMPLSARIGEDAAAAAPEEAAPAAAPPAQSTQERVQEVLSALQELGDDFYAYTTHSERAEVRRATCPPRRALQRAVHANPESSLLTTSLVAIVLGVVVGTIFTPQPSSSSPAYQGTASSSCKRAVERMLHYA